MPDYPARPPVEARYHRERGFHLTLGLAAWAIGIAIVVAGAAAVYLLSG